MKKCKINFWATYFDEPECIKISQKSPKIAYFPGPSPPRSPPGLCPWIPPGGLKRPPGPPAALAKIVPRTPPVGGGSWIRTWVTMTKNTPFFPRILHVLAPLNDVRAYIAWSWKTTPITWFFFFFFFFFTRMISNFKCKWPPGVFFIIIILYHFKLCEWFFF